MFETTGQVEQAEILFEGTRSKGCGVVEEIHVERKGGQCGWAGRIIHGAPVLAALLCNKGFGLPRPAGCWLGIPIMISAMSLVPSSLMLRLHPANHERAPLFSLSCSSSYCTLPSFIKAQVIVTKRALNSFIRSRAVKFTIGDERWIRNLEMDLAPWFAINVRSFPEIANRPISLLYIMPVSSPSHEYTH